MIHDNTHEEMKASLDRQVENKTNKSNTRCLIILAVILLFCDLLNEIGIFQVAPFVMRVGTLCGMIFYLTPAVFLCRPLRLFSSGEAKEYRPQYKYLIIAFTWLGTITSCITLSHHTIMAMAVPILIMAQYRNTRQLVPLTIVFSIICVFLSVYGGYFFGCFDSNLLHIEITDSNAFDLALRRSLATPQRMLDLLTHYVLPRVLVVLSLVLLATMISRRNDEMLKQQVKLQYEVEREMRRTNEIQRQIIDGMANLIENRDTSTGEHVKRTSYYVRRIVEQLSDNPAYRNELSGDKGTTIVKAAPLHDIGKITVADRILQKPGRLTAEEYDEIKHHAAEGAKVIENVLGSIEDAPFLRAANDISCCHHERWDGTGYPKGLRGSDIPLSARIMAVADVFDALVSERVYKSEMSTDEAFAIIEDMAGKQFDPDVAEAFCRLRPEIQDYLNAH